MSIKSIVRDLTYKPKERTALFLSLSPEQKPIVLLRLSKYIQTQLLKALSKDDIVNVLERLDPDDATDVLQLVSPRKQKDILEVMSTELQTEISLLLQFDPKTAAGLMSLNYIQVDENQRLSETTERIQVHEKRTGKFPMILSLANGKLSGYLPVSNLVKAKPSDRVGDFTKKIMHVKQAESAQSVINHFLENPHKRMAVLGDNGAILGVIYSDDVLRVIEEREATSLYDFAGVHTEETVFSTVRQKVGSRYKWLLINLCTAFLASFTVGLFDETIAKYVVLAAYMPIVAGMGGNAATQTLAILVRGIALKQIELRTALPTLRKELGASLINGLINGIVVATIAILFNHDPKIALILAVAMVSNLLVAAFFGTLIPLIMVKLKKDPATSATIFITTATDVLGFLVFLGLATIVLD